ncbi:MAG: glycine zipper 2TM domain-containing protein [Betaproteobacteria bacterium]
MLRKLVTISVALGGLALATFPTDVSAHDEPVVGTLAGAGIGAAVAGPPGAAVGAVLGAIIGATVAHESDHGRHARREARYVEYSRAEIRGPRSGRDEYASYTPYARARPACEPAPARYRTTVAYREDATRRVSTAAAERPKYRKVCRYVKADRVSSARP